MKSWRILVADDEPLVLRVIRDILSTLPANVLEAKDGEEAVRLAKAERPDLILLDVMMPRMDGFQVAEVLKKDPSTAAIPVVFVSALGASRDKVRGLNLGAEDYLAKPIDAEELKARVRMILRRLKPAKPETALASGQLQAMNLVSLVQLFEGERRTTRLLLTRGGEQGEIVFQDGRIAQAVQGPRRGEAAVYQLITWLDGTFQMAPHDASKPVGGEVAASNQGLLMEGMRRLDEIPGLRTGLPEPPVPLAIPATLKEAVHQQARGDVAALVALLDGTRDLDQVLIQSPFDPWMTLNYLQRLQALGGLESAAASGERRGTRLNVELPVEYQSLRTFQKAATFNLSARGIFIRTAAPFEVGEQVILRFQLPGQETWIKVVGQVVWRNADASRRTGVGMGLRFLDLAEADQEAIQRYLAEAIVVQIRGALEHP